MKEGEIDGDEVGNTIVKIVFNFGCLIIFGISVGIIVEIITKRKVKTKMIKIGNLVQTEVIIIIPLNVFKCGIVYFA